jgi:succinyl-CoA synthetase alpha subunit
MLRVYTHLKRGKTRLVGPNCPGILSPGKANVGIIPAHFFSEGNVGLVSRSGTLTTPRSSASAAIPSSGRPSSTSSPSSRRTRRPS